MYSISTRMYKVHVHSQGIADGIRLNILDPGTCHVEKSPMGLLVLDIQPNLDMTVDATCEAMINRLVHLNIAQINTEIRSRQFEH